MPNIETFKDNVAAPRADSAGSEAFEMEGRHIESAYAQAGSAIGGGIARLGDEAVTHEEIQDTSTNSKAAADAFSSLSAQLSQTAQQAAADPANADKHFAAFQQTMEDTIGNIGSDNVTDAGQKNARNIQNTLREEFTRQTIGTQSIVSGQQVVSSLTDAKNSMAQAVSNNPTLLPTAINLLRGTMEDQLAAHKLQPDEAARVRSEFTEPAVKDLGIAAFTTMAQKNPDAAKAALTSGQFATMFSGEEIDHLNRYADEQSKAMTVAQKAAIEQQKQQDEAAFKQTTSQLIGSMIQPDGSLTVPKDVPQAIVKASLMPGADPGEIRSLAQMTHTIIKDQAEGAKIVSDPHTFSSFGDKMLDGSLTARDVYDARDSGMLSDKDTGYFLSGMKNLEADPARKSAEKQFNDWANAQKPAFTHGSGLLGLPDPQGMAKFNQFQQAAHEQFEQAYATKGDWQGLLNAKNSGYLGKLAPQYMANVKGARLPPPPRFSNDAGVEGFLKTAKPGTPFIGPDGKQYWTK